MRDLTKEEYDILAHVVLDPDAWWLHAQEHDKPGFDCEKALAEKISRWQPKYESEKKLLKDKYLTRAEKENATN